jgi:hypothetical protein
MIVGALAAGVYYPVRALLTCIRKTIVNNNKTMLPLVDRYFLREFGRALYIEFRMLNDLSFLKKE